MGAIVEIDIDLEKLDADIQYDLRVAGYETLKVMMKDVEPYVPYDTGELDDSVFIDVMDLAIVWETEYSEYVYDMPTSNNFKRDVHPNATSQWASITRDIYIDKWIEVMRRNFAKRR